MKDLVKYYEQRLIKVKSMHPVRKRNTESQNDKAQGYIDNAKEQLTAVKNGREWYKLIE